VSGGIRNHKLIQNKNQFKVDVSMLKNERRDDGYVSKRRRGLGVCWHTPSWQAIGGDEAPRTLFK
jgi:hypothetical protein